MSALYYHKKMKKWVARGRHEGKDTYLGYFLTKEEGQAAIDVFHRTHIEAKKKKYDMHKLVSNEVFDFNIGCLSNYYHILKRTDWNAYTSVYGKNDVYFFPDEEVPTRDVYKPTILG